MLEEGSAPCLQMLYCRKADHAVGLDVQAHLKSKAIDGKASTITFGLDRGFPDLDLSRNDDSAAIQTDMDNDEEHISTTKEGMEFDLNKGAPYYSQPVVVGIPRLMDPLPAVLLENRMNLLYFHHFLNHTARTLVAHDCSGNPFREILPKSEYTESVTRGWSRSGGCLFQAASRACHVFCRTALLIDQISCPERFV